MTETNKDFGKYTSFAEVVKIIEDARSNAYRKVNEELILMY